MKSSIKNENQLPPSARCGCLRTRFVRYVSTAGTSSTNKDVVLVLPSWENGDSIFFPLLDFLLTGIRRR